MYKFTIFTIIFSIIVLVVVANLVITDFRAKDKAATETTKEEIKKIETEKPKIKVSEENISAFPSEEKVYSASSVLGEEFWKKAGIAIEEKRSNLYKESIFNILTPNSTSNLAVYLHEIIAGEFKDSAIYEVICVDSIGAKASFENFLKQGSESIVFSVNQTNEFGDLSFFLNDNDKKDTVFLIILKRNVIYAVAYLKSSHAKNLQLLKDLP